jgi:hypothetical protein
MSTLLLNSPAGHASHAFVDQKIAHPDQVPLPLSLTLFYGPAKRPHECSEERVGVGARLIAPWGGVTGPYVGPAPGAINRAPTSPGPRFARLSLLNHYKKCQGERVPLLVGRHLAETETPHQQATGIKK